MSSITTWGWGAQGGLVTIGGWGGTAHGAPAMPVRLRPRLSRAFELAPQITTDEGDVEPKISVAKELRPQVVSENAALVPRMKNLEVKPKLTSTPKKSQQGPRAIGKEIKPKITSETKEKTPRTKVKELRPQVVSGAKTKAGPKQPRVKEIKPKVTDGQGD